MVGTSGNLEELGSGRYSTRPLWKKRRAVEPGTKERPAREHLLLTVLGTNPSLTRYALEHREAESRFAAAALFDLLPEERRPGRVLALCTPEAEQESFPLLEGALGMRVSVKAIQIPTGNTQSDVNTYLEKVIGAIQPCSEITVDVTHGFRHLSFLTYIAVLYLAALRGVKVRGAYYGMLSPVGPSPFLDLRPLLDLPRWVYALEVLRDTGSALPMARNLLNGPDGQPARDNARDLEHFSEAYLSALPLELGWQARNLLDRRRKPLRKLLGIGNRLPLAEKLVERFAEILEPFAFNEPISGDGWKRRVQLSGDELERQAAIIDDLRRRGSLATALRLMREWTVSWAIFQQAPDGDWLSRSVRHKAEGLLHALKAICGDRDLCGVLTEDQRRFGRFWGDLAEVRNAYAHHGMFGDDLVRDGKIAATRDRALKFWKETLRFCPDFSVSLGESPGGRVLVSPIGLRPGVLFSALQAFRANGERGQPALCVVICSRETEVMIAAALERAGFAGKFEPLVLEDAFGGGYAEIKRVAKAARAHFIGAAEVLVNVTGGTTLMGLAAEELAAEARSLACPVRRFGLIDRRPAERQDTDPYQTGEPFWLDSGEEVDVDRD